MEQRAPLAGRPLCWVGGTPHLPHPAPLHDTRIGGQAIRIARYDSAMPLSASERDHMAEQMTGPVLFLARRHHPQPPLDTDDLIQEGMLAVWKLAQGWTRPRREYINAAWYAADRRMVDAIRRNRWGKRKGGALSDHVPPVSLSYHTTDSRTVDIEDTIEDPARPLEVVDALIALGRRPDRRRARMLLLQGLGFTLTEIADEYGISEGRVSQLLGRTGLRNGRPDARRSRAAA